MIVVCTCGTKSRIRDLSLVHKTRCAHCKTMLGPEAHRQAERNAAIVLEVATLLWGKLKRLTPSDELIANVLARHQMGAR